MKVSLSIDLVTITCCRNGCGVVFAVPSDFEGFRRKDHQLFYCPNGHDQHFPGETREEKACKELARERANHDQTKAALRDKEAKLIAKDKETSRLKKRVKNGVCPCCKRSFVNLASHMKTEHPKFAETPTNG